MLEIRFYDDVDDGLLQFAVVLARHRGKWVLCKHRERESYECPGGHRDAGEAIGDTAGRELWEETGAEEYELRKLGVYSVVSEVAETFGMMYFGEITRFGALPPMEMEKIELFDILPENWTYPEIQPRLIERVKELGLVP